MLSALESGESVIPRFDGGGFLSSLVEPISRVAFCRRILGLSSAVYDKYCEAVFSHRERHRRVAKSHQRSAKLDYPDSRSKPRHFLVLIVP